MMGVQNTRNMQCEASSGIQLTAYSCICWLFHRRNSLNYVVVRFGILYFIFLAFNINQITNRYEPHGCTVHQYHQTLYCRTIYTAITLTTSITTRTFVPDM